MSSSPFRAPPRARSRARSPRPWSRCWRRSPASSTSTRCRSRDSRSSRVQYKVGEPRTQAIVRLYNAIYSHQDWRPPNAGILPPLIRPMGIDDVPIVTLTLWTTDPTRGSYQLGEVARSIETQLLRVPGTRKAYTIGAPAEPGARRARSAEARRLRTDPARGSARSLEAANLVRQAGCAGRQRSRRPGAGGRVPGEPRRCGGSGGRRLPGQTGVSAGRCERLDCNPTSRTPTSGSARVREPGARGLPAGSLRAGGHHRRREEARHQRDHHCPAGDRARAAAARHLHPRGRARHRHAQLRRDREPEGDEAHREAHLRHRLGRAAGPAHDGAARGAWWSARRSP